MVILNIRTLDLTWSGSHKENFLHQNAQGAIPLSILAKAFLTFSISTKTINNFLYINSLNQSTN